MRICLLGSPRCGSQYIVELICQAVDNDMFDCQEPFVFGNCDLHSIENLNGKMIKSKHKNFASLADQCSYIVNTINSIDPTQSLILRLFLDETIEPFLPTISKELKKNNFQFISIKRLNVENQLLSFAIASTTNRWNTIGNGSYIDGDQYKIHELHHMNWLYTNLIKYDDRINSLNIEYKTIRYEHTTVDLSEILQIPITPRPMKLKKQVVGDPYNMIDNADEVREHIKRLLNDTTIH